MNFNFPYFSKSIPEFWSRWHISLSLWLNDYVFTPLALNFRHYGKHGLFLAVFITFLLAGLWHGAAWHFVFYGAYFGVLYLPSIYGKKGIKALVKKKPEDITYKDIPRILLTFTLVCFGYLFFRSSGINQALEYLKNIVVGNIEHPGQFLMLPGGIMSIICISILLLVDWHFRRDERKLLLPKNMVFRWLIYFTVIFSAFIISRGSDQQFIYFQF